MAQKELTEAKVLKEYLEINRVHGMILLKWILYKRVSFLELIPLYNMRQIGVF
jgi:hypothetical protein